MPANELSDFMKNFFKVFEKSSSQFNDINDREKINKALQKIKDPISEFQKKAENTKTLLIPVEEIEKSKKIENINEIVKETHRIMENLKEKSKNISNKIQKLMKKYGEESAHLKSMNINAPEPIKISEFSKKLFKKF